MKTAMINEFVEKIHFPALIISTDLVILATNKLHEKMSGYTSMELAGRTITSQRLLEVRDEISLHGTWEGEMTFHTKSGKPYSVYMIIMGCVIDGQRYFCSIKTPSSSSALEYFKKTMKSIAKSMQRVLAL